MQQSQKHDSDDSIADDNRYGDSIRPVEVQSSLEDVMVSGVVRCSTNRRVRDSERRALEGS